MEEATAGRLLGHGDRLLHAEQVADLVKVVGVAVLLADALLDELVPVVGREHSVAGGKHGNVTRMTQKSRQTQMAYVTMDSDDSGHYRLRLSYETQVTTDSYDPDHYRLR